jgi:predicted XRE-type DNA-binding protein
MPASVELQHLHEELDAIKRLLVFALLQQPNITQAQVAAALGTSQSQVSKMLAAKAK